MSRAAPRTSTSRPRCARLRFRIWSERWSLPFFVDAESVREAVRRRASFNVLHRETMMKVDLFVLSGSNSR